MKPVPYHPYGSYPAQYVQVAVEDELIIFVTLHVWNWLLRFGPILTAEPMLILETSSTGTKDVPAGVMSDQYPSPNGPWIACAWIPYVVVVFAEPPFFAYTKPAGKLYSGTPTSRSPARTTVPATYIVVFGGMPTTMFVSLTSFGCTLAGPIVLSRYMKSPAVKPFDAPPLPHGGGRGESVHISSGMN